MSIVKTVITACVPVAMATYLKTPRSAKENCPEVVYHGSDANRLKVTPGEPLIVRENGLFFTHTEDAARAFATEGISAYRSSEEEAISSKPVVVALRILDENTVFQRGLLGGHCYFPKGTKLHVEKITHLPPPCKEQQEKLKQELDRVNRITPH